VVLLRRVAGGREAAVGYYRGFSRAVRRIQSACFPQESFFEAIGSAAFARIVRHQRGAASGGFIECFRRGEWHRS
jgi:hypothetical protein